MGYVYNPFTSRIEYYEDPTEYKAKDISGQIATWDSLSDLPNTRRTVAAAANSSGEVFVAGGRAGGDYYNTFYVYSGGVWSSSTIPQTLWGAMGVCDSSGNFHLIGGALSSGTTVNTHYIYDGSSWATSSGTLNTARHVAAIAIDSNDKIYISHGYDGSSSLSSLERYDPTTSAFVTLSSASAARRYVAGDIMNNKLYVFCGYTTAAVSTIEEYDISAGTWSTVSPTTAPQARYGLAAAYLPDGKIHLAGGATSGTNYVVTHESFDGTNCATETTDMTSPARSYLGSGGHGYDRLWCVGGYDGSDYADVDYCEIGDVICYPIVDADDC